MITTLNPIVTNQILDTINGTSPDISSKKKMIDNNHVLSVNGRNVYHAYTDEEYIYYFLRRNSSTKYYYPIAFAKVEITEDGATAPITSGDLPADVLVGEGTLPEPPHQ